MPLPWLMLWTLRINLKLSTTGTLYQKDYKILLTTLWKTSVHSHFRWKEKKYNTL